jgi:15-cis-phytoene synthase
MADPCMDIVRLWQRDRYLAALFAPDDKRPHLFALYAFDAEVARIPSTVSEPQIGEIRLQWWLDTVDGIFDGHPQDHPVAKALAETIVQFNLPKQALRGIVEARQFDLYADQMPSRNDLEGYLGETQSGVIQLACLILAGASAAKVGRAAGFAGVAYGLGRILNEHPKRAQFIPAGETVESLASLARKRLAEARETPVEKIYLPAFLPVTLTENYLKSLGKKPFALGLQWALWRAARREKF